MQGQSLVNRMLAIRPGMQPKAKRCALNASNFPETSDL
jgi:hypothetical protein